MVKAYLTTQIIWTLHLGSKSSRRYSNLLDIYIEAKYSLILDEKCKIYDLCGTHELLSLSTSERYYEWITILSKDIIHQDTSYLYVAQKEEGPEHGI